DHFQQAGDNPATSLAFLRLIVLPAFLQTLNQLFATLPGGGHLLLHVRTMRELPLGAGKPGSNELAGFLEFQRSNLDFKEIFAEADPGISITLDPGSDEKSIPCPFCARRSLQQLLNRSPHPAPMGGIEDFVESIEDPQDWNGPPRPSKERV
ncbi:MAG: hypothetical protein ACK56I_18900, partial [bacterium]